MDYKIGDIFLWHKYVGVITSLSSEAIYFKFTCLRYSGIGARAGINDNFAKSLNSILWTPTALERVIYGVDEVLKLG